MKIANMIKLLKEINRKPFYGKLGIIFSIFSEKGWWYLPRLAFCNAINSRFYLKKLNKKYIKIFEENKDEFKLSGRSEEIYNELKQNGVAIADVSDFFEDGFLEGLRKDYDQMLASENTEDGIYRETNCEYKYGECKYYDRYILNEEFHKIISNYLNMIPRYNQLNTVKIKEQDSGGRMGAQKWHKDQGAAAIVHVVIYLNDVTAENGAFEYVKETHLHGKYNDILSRQDEKTNCYNARIEVDVDGLYPELNERHINCEGKAGSIVFTDPVGLHRAGYCTKGHRDTIFLTTMPFSGTQRVDINFDKQYKNDVPNKFVGQSVGIKP